MNPTSPSPPPAIVPGPLTATMTALDLGQSTDLSGSATGGQGALTFAWSGLPAGCSSTNASSLACTPSGTGTSFVTLTISDHLGTVVVEGAIELIVAPALGTPTVTVSTSSVVTGGLVVLTATFSGGTAPYSYAWIGLPAGCVSANTPSLACAPSATGSFTASVRVTDAAGAAQIGAGPGVSVTAPPSTTATPSTANGGLIVPATALGAVALVLALLALLLVLMRGRAGPPPAAPSKKSQDWEEDENETSPRDAKPEGAKVKAKASQDPGPEDGTEGA